MFAKSVTTRTRRLMMVLGTLGLAAVWAPAPVGAQGPPAPLDVTFVSSLCHSFDVEVSAQGKLGFLTLPNDLQIITFPALKATVTHIGTDKKVNLSITGTEHDLASGLRVFVGSNLIFRSVADGDTVDTIAYVTGRYSFAPFDGVGTYTDICELLA
jgi:hypothetical protein